MSDSNREAATQALFSEGLRSYWDAKLAMQDFEAYVSGPVKALLEGRYDALAHHLNLPARNEKTFEEHRLPNFRSGAPAIGCSFICEDGARIGLGWIALKEDRTLQPVASFSIIFSAMYKLNTAQKSMQDYAAQRSATETEILAMAGWPYELAVFRHIPGDADLHALRCGLEQILDFVVDWGAHVGGRNALLYPQ